LSTILKALRRLEQDKTHSTQRPLREEVVLSRARSGGSRRVAGLIAAAAAVSFVVAFVVLARLDGDAPAPAPLPPVASPPQAPAPAPAVTVPPTTVMVSPSGVAPAAPLAAAAPLQPAPAAVAPAPAMPAPAPRAAATLPPPLPVAEPDEELFVRPLAPPPSRIAREDEEEAALARAQAAVPIGVERTSWHPHADRRVAWVTFGAGAARQVREGDKVGVFEVVEIEPDGVLFADGPLEVRRSVGQR
jgi:hypothetical protein